jgi:hypothetical protein
MKRPNFEIFCANLNLSNVYIIEIIMKSIIAKDNLVIMQFVPIVLLLVYLVYPYKFHIASNSVLGKLCAIMMIMYYTRMDFIYGTISCFIVILYYQMLVVEENFEPSSVKTKVYKRDSKLVDSKLVDSKLVDPEIISIEQFHAAKDEFIKEKCKNGVLMYKDLPVKSEMADHIYSEIKFNTQQKCNPCDRTCDYNIIEAKLKTEQELIPKTSKNLLDYFSS